MRCWTLTVWCMMHLTRCVMQLLGCFQGAAALWCAVCMGELHSSRHSCSRGLQLPPLPQTLTTHVAGFQHPQCLSPGEVVCLTPLPGCTSR